MGCNSCGTSRCSCGPNTGPGIGVIPLYNGGSAIGCCGNVAPPTPLNCNTGCGSGCLEPHAQQIIVNSFSAVLKTANSWNVPDCGGSAIIQVNGLKAIGIGSYLFNASYGFYEIVGFNSDNSTITIQNNCTDGNSTVGTQIPACAEFTVVGPPLDSSGGGQPSLYPYVAIDFTAPNVSTCLLITVTTINGLQVGKNVQIGSGTYRVASVNGNNTIQICNDGFGITPGTSVIAKNATGNYQYPVVIIDANPCTADTVTSGAILVCSSDNASPLSGATEGMVPVLIDAETGEVQYELLSVPTRTCSTITCCLTLVDGQAAYTIPVGDSLQFVVGDILQIGTRTDRFTVTAILDATHVQGTLSPVPDATVDIPVATSLCVVDCCETLQAEIDALEVTVGDIRSRNDEQSGSSLSAGTLNSGNLSITQACPTVSLGNPSPGSPMQMFYDITCRVRGRGGTCNTKRLVLGLVLEISLDGGAFGVVSEDYHLEFSSTDNLSTFDRQLNYAASTNIAAGDTGATLDARLVVIWAAGVGLSEAGSTYQVEQIACKVSTIGIATT